MPAHWLDLEPDDDLEDLPPDTATEIASEGPSLAYARRIEVVDGRLLFAEDLPMEHAVMFRDIDYLGRDGRAHHCEILRNEYKVPSGGKSAVKTGDALHMVLRPFSNLQSLAVPFRGAVNRTPEERARRFKLLERGVRIADDSELPEHLLRFGSDEEARRHVECETADYWEKGKYLTAGFSAGPDREGERSRSAWKRGYVVLGICPGGVDGVRELEVSKVAGELLAWTDEGPFPFKRDSNLRLHPGVQAKAMDWLKWAAQQTLAGPIEHMNDRKGLPIGTPVERLLIRRYRNLLIHAHRDLTGARRKDDLGTGVAPTGRSSDDHGDTSLERRIDWNSYEQWKDDEVDDPMFVSLEDAEDELGYLL